MVSRDYPDSPLLGVSVLVRRGGRVLLVKRGRAPLAGLWSLPGGLVDVGERLDAAAAREVREETGVAIAGLASVGFEEVIDTDDDGRPRLHYVLVVFAASHVEGEPVAGDDAAEAAWVAPANPDGLPLTDGTARRLAEEAAA